MSESSNPTYENYRYSSVGTVKIYGNCVEIQEHTDVVTPDVVRNEVQREMEHVQYVNELFDKAFENHVMEYGQDFEKHDFWFCSFIRESRPENSKDWNHPNSI